MEELIKQLTPLGTKRVVKKNTILLYQGEAPRMAYLVKRGDVRVYTINSAGEEQVVTIQGTNEMFPGPWIFNKSAVSLYYYETTGPCEIITIPRDVLHKHMYQPHMMPAIIECLASNYVGMLMRTTAVQQSRARNKIMFTLYYLMFKYGREHKDGLFRILLPLTHGTIASLVGLTRETTTTELNILKRKQVLSYEHRMYTVNKPKLERLLGEDSFAQITL